MKKILVITIVVTIILAIGIILVTKSTKQSDSDSNSDSYSYSDIEYRVISRYSDEENIVISDIKEYEEFIENSNLQEIHLDKYDKQFFEGKSLAIAFVDTNSGSNRIIIGDIKVIGNKLNIEYYIQYPESEIGTMDMAGEIIIVEIDKNVNEINLKREK